MELQIYSRWVRSTGDKLDLLLVPGTGGGETVLGLNPQTMGSATISEWIQSGLT